jgi:hypothetical protein
MDPAFERAFVAMTYCLGARGDDAFGSFSLGPEARSLVRALASGDREARALVLARELLRIAVALEKGSLV